MRVFATFLLIPFSLFYDLVPWRQVLCWLFGHPGWIEEQYTPWFLRCSRCGGASVDWSKIGPKTS